MLLFIITAAIIVTVVWAVYSYGNGLVNVRSNVDGRDYMVQDKPDAQQAADALGSINKGIQKLLASKEIEQAAQAENKSFELKRIRDRFDPTALSERGHLDMHTTFTINKGDRMVFCLRSRDQNSKVHEDNLLMFVALHELAHIASTSMQHTQEFHDNFEFLLRAAKTAGVYQHVPFKQTPQMYCGILITGSPGNE